jgi:hypothetical protein
MKHRHPSLGSAVLALAAALLFLALAAPASRAATADVGLVTKLAGEVTYFNEAFQKEPAKARAFMKIRQGDRFTLAAGAEVRLVYFASAIQETWQGPAVLMVGVDKSQPAAGVGQPRVQALAADAAGGVKRLPALLQGKRPVLAGQTADRLTYTGQIAVRGADSKGEEEVPPLSPQAQSEIMSAEAVYQKAVKEAAPDDILPELVLMGVLAEHRRYRRMETILEIAYRKQPDTALLKDVEKTVYRPEDYNLFLRELMDLKNPSSPFAVRLKLNKTRFRVGDPMTLSFTVDRDCYLILLDIATNQMITVLFPSPGLPDGRIKKGQTYTLPTPEMGSGLQVTGPKGMETLKVLATLKAPALPPRNVQDQSFHLIDESNLRELRNLIETMRQTPASDWTETSLEFRID